MAFFTLLRILFIGVCALALLVQTRVLLNLPLGTPFLDGFVGLGTVFGYYWTHPARRIRLAAWLCGMSGGVMLVLWLLKGGQVWLVTVPAVTWFAYYGFRRPGQAGLRAYPVAKPITVAFTWAWTTVILPALGEISAGVLIIALERAAFIFALALAYDLTDMDYDHRRGLETLVQRFSAKQVFQLITIFFAVSALLVLTNFIRSVYSVYSAEALLLSLLSGLAALWQMFATPSLKPFRKILIDALIPLQSLLVLLLR